MISLIRDNYNVLQSLGSFGIALGFGDKTVNETCQDNGVDTYTFLSVVNYTINGYYNSDEADRLHIPTLLHYLEASHIYYLDYQLPSIRRDLKESINEEDRLGVLIMKFYDEYAREIRKHMKYEEKVLFPYVKQLLDGNAPTDYDIETFSKHHGQTNEKLKELKSIIIKYLPSDPMRNNMLTATLYDIYNLEEWLKLHVNVEEQIFEPTIKLLEKQQNNNDVSLKISNFIGSTENTETLSDREKDVVIGVVQGLTNKEIADKLHISLTTVISHRKNITEKLGIKSVAGLTIYAVMHGYVEADSI